MALGGGRGWGAFCSQLSGEACVRSGMGQGARPGPDGGGTCCHCVCLLPGGQADLRAPDAAGQAWTHWGEPLGALAVSTAGLSVTAASTASPASTVAVTAAVPRAHRATVVLGELRI